MSPAAAKPKNLNEALLALQGEAPPLKKDATNPHFDSKYVSLDTMVETITPLLVKHGLTWTTYPSFVEATGMPVLRYVLTHAPTGEKLEGTMPLMLVKDDPQAQGSALTYARRYSMSAVLNLVADEDDDGNRAQASSEAAKGMASEKAAKYANSLLKRAGLSDEEREAVATWGLKDGKWEKESASVVINALATKGYRDPIDQDAVNALLEEVGAPPRSDVPADEEGLLDPEEQEGLLDPATGDPEEVLP